MALLGQLLGRPATPQPPPKSAPRPPADALAEVFDRLLWCRDDNGDAILRVREKWLQFDDAGASRLPSP